MLRSLAIKEVHEKTATLKVLLFSDRFNNLRIDASTNNYFVKKFYIFIANVQFLPTG